MTPDPIPEALMSKAWRACTSARLLLVAGDVDGACNRAYYPMFDAARAALLTANAPVSPDVGKTHGGLISAFGLQLVRNGRVSNELGRALNRAEEIRQVADYRGDSVEFDDAREMVEQADVFVEAMRAEFMPDSRKHDDAGIQP